MLCTMSADLDRLKQMEEQEAPTEEDEETFKKYCRQEMQLLSKFQTHRQAFLEVVIEFRSMRMGA